MDPDDNPFDRDVYESQLAIDRACGDAVKEDWPEPDKDWPDDLT